MSDCPFCAIAAGDLKADVVAEGDTWVAFRDLNPQAPTHVLIIPRRHIPTLNDVPAGETDGVGALVQAAIGIARAEGLDADGYRLIFNTNVDGGQSVFHIHLHLLGGRPMRWPPG